MPGKDYRAGAEFKLRPDRRKKRAKAALVALAIVVWINNPDRVGCCIQGVRKDIMPPKIMSTVLIEKPCLDPQDAGRIGIKC